MSESVELIKSEISKRAKDETDKIILEAKKEAKEIITTAEKKAHEVMTNSVKPEVEVMKRRILGSAMLEGRKMMLKIKYEIVLNVLNSVEEKLRRIANKEEKSIDYDKILLNLLKEGITKIDEDEIIVSSNKKDLSYITANLKKIESQLSKTLNRKVKLIIQNKPQNYIGGVIVQTKDGKKIFNNTLDGRLLSLRESLRGKILKEFQIEP